MCPIRTLACRLPLLAAILAAGILSGCTGVGFIAGKAVDDSLDAVMYPIREFVCLGAYKYDNDDERPWRALEDDRKRNYGKELVGVAVSGGGSRSAYFLAAALDAMRMVPAPGGTGTARTMLDEIDFISSVSGGSLSSAYYVTKRPRTSDPAALDAFFEQYREDMAKNFEARSLGRLLLMFRWVPRMFTYYDRAHLLAGVWDAHFFSDMTFADLPPPGGPIPTLIINGASYSTGNKFIFSRLPSARFNESFTFRHFNETRVVRGGAAAEFTPFFTSGFDTLDSDIGSYKLSLAVAASASVPGLLGPIVLKSRKRAEDDVYEMIGDGGLYDNYGLETLVQLFATILEERPGLQARIILVDGSGYFPARLDRESYGIGDYVDRMSSIAWLRSSQYTEVVFRLLRFMSLEGQSPGNPHSGRIVLGARERSPFRNARMHLVSMYHESTEQELEKEASTLRRIAGWIGGQPVKEALRDFSERVRGIGTRFSIDDDSIALLEIRARAAVQYAFFGQPPAPPPAPRAASK